MLYFHQAHTVSFHTINEKCVAIDSVIILLNYYHYFIFIIIKMSMGEKGGTVRHPKAGVYKTKLQPNIILRYSVTIDIRR